MTELLVILRLLLSLLPTFALGQLVDEDCRFNYFIPIYVAACNIKKFHLVWYMPRIHEESQHTVVGGKGDAVINHIKQCPQNQTFPIFGIFVVGHIPVFSRCLQR